MHTGSIILGVSFQNAQLSDFKDFIKSWKRPLFYDLRINKSTFYSSLAGILFISCYMVFVISSRVVAPARPTPCRHCLLYLQLFMLP